MDTAAAIGLGLIGFFVGNLLFSKVIVWAATICEIVKDGSATPKAARLAAATLLGAGPWFLIVATMFAYFVRAEWWATPLFIGAASALVFFSLLTVHFALKARAKCKPQHLSEPPLKPTTKGEQP
jgi:hypothetical protein